MDSAPIDIGLPEKMEMRDHGSYIEIVRRWLGLETVVLTAFAILWDWFFFSTQGWVLFFLDGTPFQAESLLLFLIPLVQIGVGVVLTYKALAGWLNRTHVYASKELVGIRHRPLPWFGNKDIAVADLKQLYAKEKTEKARFRTKLGSSNRVSYEVRAVTNSGRNVKLVGDLDTQEQAIFIEQQIEKYVGIEDRSVQGEIHKRSAWLDSPT